MLKASVFIPGLESQRWQVNLEYQQSRGDSTSHRASLYALGCPHRLCKAPGILSHGRDLSFPLLTVQGQNEETEENTMGFKQSLWKFLSVPDLGWVVTCSPQWRGHHKVLAPESSLINCLCLLGVTIIERAPRIGNKEAPSSEISISLI